MHNLSRNYITPKYIFKLKTYMLSCFLGAIDKKNVSTVLNATIQVCFSYLQ